MPISRRLTIQALMAAAAMRPAWAQSAAIKLSTTAVNDLDVEWLTLLKTNLEAASGGKIKANVYPASQLGSAETTIEGVTMGTIEVAINASGTYEGLEPRMAVFSVPGIIQSMAQGAKVMADPDVRRMYGAIARDKGVEVLTALADAPAGIVSRRPIATLADFKGMKIRVPGSPLLVEQLKAVGASPIAMSLGEVLPAFQNGTIDGVYAGTTIFTALKYYDIAKSMTLLPSTFLVIIGLVNSDFMTGLGASEAAFRTAARKADADGAVWGEADVAHGAALWEQNGGKTLMLPPEDAKKYLDIVVPAALRNLSAATRADYDVLKAASVKYS